MRQIKIDGQTIPPDDPITKLFNLCLDIRDAKKWVSPLAVNFDAGVPNLAKITETVVIQKKNKI